MEKSEETNQKAGGFYYQEIGQSLQIKPEHSLQDLTEFAQKYGVDLPLHLTGRGMTVQIATTVVVPKN